MSDEFMPPHGWASVENPTYDFGEARYGTGPEDIPSNPVGEGNGEVDSHLKYVDPEGKFGAAKVGGGEKSSYGNEDNYKPKAGEKDVKDTGVLDLPPGHVVIESGNQAGRNYYLVQEIDSKKYYTVIPNFKEGEQYKSPLKPDRTSALGEAYRVISAALPDDALAQLRQRFPETPALKNVYD
jgi:hypothetical protein